MTCNNVIITAAREKNCDPFVTSLYHASGYLMGNQSAHRAFRSPTSSFVRNLRRTSSMNEVPTSNGVNRVEVVVGDGGLEDGGGGGVGGVGVYRSQFFIGVPDHATACVRVFVRLVAHTRRHKTHTHTHTHEHADGEATIPLLQVS